MLAEEFVWAVPLQELRALVKGQVLFENHCDSGVPLVIADFIYSSNIIELSLDLKVLCAFL
jgi:hypothetical protein